MKTLMVAALALSLGATAAHAGDAKRGEALTQRWCTGCHVIGDATHGQDSAPALPTLAGRHAHDQEWLRAWLTSPHPPMPNLNLTRQEIDDVTAYLSSLPKS